MLASLHSQSPLHGLNSGQPKRESHTPGTSTLAVAAGDDITPPSHFIACIHAKKARGACARVFVPSLGVMLSKSLSGKMFRQCKAQLDAHPAQIKRQDHNVMTHAEMYLSSRALVSSWLYWRTGERDPLSLGPSRLQQSVLASWAAHNEVTVQTRSSRREYMKNVVSVDKNG